MLEEVHHWGWLFEVLEAQTRPSGSFCLPTACRFRSGTLSPPLAPCPLGATVLSTMLIMDQSSEL